MTARERADRLLVERGLFESRARAQAAIAAGLVTADGVPVRKASEAIPSAAVIARRARASVGVARRRQACSRARSISARRRPAASASTSAPRPAASPKCCSRAARGASMRSTSAAASCIRACAAAAISSRWRRPISAALDPARLAGAAGFRHRRCQLHLAQARRCPAIGSILEPRGNAPRADQAAIRGRPPRHQERHRARRRRPHRGLRRHRRLRRLRSAGASAASRRRRSSAATATANFSSRRSVVERLTIDRIGHRGDGVVDERRGADLRVRHAARRDASRSRPCPAIPTAGSCCASTRRAPSASRRSARISASAAAAPCSIGRPNLIAPGSATSWSTALRQAGIEAPVGDLIDAHGDGRRRAVFHARRGGRDILEVGFSAARAHHVIAIDRCPILAPSSRRRAPGRVGDRRSARAGREAARHPGHRDR